MLKSSIIQFRQDIQKQAKRFGVPSNAGPHFSHLPPRHNSSESNHGRQLSPTSSSLMNQSQMSLPGTGEGSKTKPSQGSSGLMTEVQDQLRSKVNRLELELSALKEQYDQQEQELTKYKEKWIKAKDSARKKKELKTGTGMVASALMMEDSAGAAESLGGQGSGGGSGSGRGDLGSIDGSMTFSVYGKDGDGAGSPSSDTPASPSKENDGDPSINPHPLSMETMSPYEASGPDQDTEESEFKIFSPSQGNTPLASAIGFQLPPQEQASLSRPAVTTPQYNSVTPTMVAASLSTSVVVDASAALLSSHLRDPATSRSAPAFTGNSMTSSIGVSAKSSPASGRGGSGTAIPIQNVSVLQVGKETGPGRHSDESATPSAPPPDLAESSVSGGSMFYSATFQ
ncbi:hypothetical protein HDU81_007467 [Chytriomyces hyalinus]|nr:hypothetical protein HDU81_007467 [Chytriomyces hyalinus]